MSLYILLMFAFVAGSMSCSREPPARWSRPANYSKPQWDWVWRFNHRFRKRMSPEDQKRHEDAVARYPSPEELTRQKEAEARDCERWAL
jgi:hypothetical protein